MNNNDTVYYLGKECKLIHKINSDESIIEILTASVCWRGCLDGPYPEPDYWEPEFTTLIVKNKHLSTEGNKLENLAKEIEKEAQKEADKILNAARDEVKELRKEVTELKSAKYKLRSKYGDSIEAIDTGLSLILKDAPYYLDTSGYLSPKLFKPEDFQDNRGAMEVWIRKTKNGKSEITFCARIYDNDYRSSDYTSYDVKACQNIEEVRIEFVKYIDEFLQEGKCLNRRIVDFAKEIGLEDERILNFEEEQKQIDRQNKLDDIQEMEDKIKTLKEELEL